LAYRRRKKRTELPQSTSSRSLRTPTTPGTPALGSRLPLSTPASCTPGSATPGSASPGSRNRIEGARARVNVTDGSTGALPAPVVLPRPNLYPDDPSCLSPNANGRKPRTHMGSPSPALPMEQPRSLVDGVQSSSHSQPEGERESPVPRAILRARREIELQIQRGTRPGVTRPMTNSLPCGRGSGAEDSPSSQQPSPTVQGDRQHI